MGHSLNREKGKELFAGWDYNPEMELNAKVRKLVDSLAFNIFVGVIIILNIIFIGLEADLDAGAGSGGASCDLSEYISVCYIASTCDHVM
jgi:hypothetical protein